MRTLCVESAFPSFLTARADRSILCDRYEHSSEGYDPAEKRQELFHPDSRFLILYSPTSADKPVGYCIFRFDTEETASDDDEELYDVAYW